MYSNALLGIYLSQLFLNQQFLWLYFLHYNNSQEFIHFNFMLLKCYRYDQLLPRFFSYVVILLYVFLILCIILKEVTHGINVKFATLAFGTFRFILSFVATGVLHSYGRRTLCIFSGTIMGVTLFISGLCYHYRTNTGNNN